ncbi:hypothetical protein AVEN_164586-1 [Araneus ventricosus]|uniref:Uncharacterized protein n=1 Tax=Araneus ventricosus TaxID=182803 RepID=A0A4Y2B352_ARAVE|nr:hypothetical protein AVEN_164586-1 [Araneus ventricosus]
MVDYESELPSMMLTRDMESSLPVEIPRNARFSTRFQALVQGYASFVLSKKKCLEEDLSFKGTLCSFSNATKENEQSSRQSHESLNGILFECHLFWKRITPHLKCMNFKEIPSTMSKPLMESR